MIEHQFFSSGCILSAEPGAFWVGSGTPERLPKFTGERGLWVYAPDFFLRDPLPWWKFSTFEKLQTHELLSELGEKHSCGNGKQDPPLPQQNDSELLTLHWEKLNPEIFRKGFDDLQKLFQSRVLKKGVPYAFEKTRLRVSPTIVCQLIHNGIRSIQTRPFQLYGLWNEEEGILGATPETLFENQVDSKISTMALAGTRFSDPALGQSQSLLEDPKQREEHQIVVDGIRDSILAFQKKTGISAGTLHFGKTTEISLGGLFHLMTPVEFEAPHLDPGLLFEDLVRALHPTPALGAFPVEAGRRWLEQYEEVLPRARFGAPFGAVWKPKDQLPGLSRCFVAIRNLQWSKDELRLGAGCGIIPASQFELEWQEILGKLDSIKELFQMTM